MITKNDIRAATVRVRAKKFANQLRGESFGWELSIPDDDIDWLNDEEIPEYKQVLISKQCVMNPTTFKWSAK
jgi:hypothetical protein